MDWLKSILQSLPLEKISDILGEIVIWWSQMVKGVPPTDLPTYAYVGGGIVVLALWVLVARVLPKPLGGISWVILFAVLFAPGTALSDPSTIAPASISVVYAVMMKDIAAAVSNSLPILVVLVVGLFIGFVWQLIRGAFESSLEEARRRMALDNEANFQLAGGNYIAEHEEVDTQSIEAPITPIFMPVNSSKPESNKDESSATQVSLHKVLKHDVSKAVATEPIAPKGIAIKHPVTEKTVANDKAAVDTPKKPKIEGFYSKKTVKTNNNKDSIVDKEDVSDAIVVDADNSILPHSDAKNETVKDLK
ncbi:hypothetical protein [Psychrobacter sp. 16-MNA-CIBAN-0192]|uniref:hypothetical protein n=1 Tax=Psychrobacter sp. 16-MNA-CIBAN-0192 TaxID=3140448 RepID=UPI00332713E3